MDTQVTKEDQEYINEFSRLHQKNKNIDGELRILNEKIANTKDASSRCDELFGDNTKIMIGETFVEVPEEKAKELITKLEEKLNKEKKDFEEMQDINKKRLNELKILLYAKFKDSINLDE